MYSSQWFLLSPLLLRSRFSPFTPHFVITSPLDIHVIPILLLCASPGQIFGGYFKCLKLMGARDEPWVRKYKKIHHVVSRIVDSVQTTSCERRQEFLKGDLDGQESFSYEEYVGRVSRLLPYYTYPELPSPSLDTLCLAIPRNTLNNTSNGRL